jgi:hypothetical protein
MMAGSQSPLRVPMRRPSRGVNPMEVSTETPPSMAAIEAPLPKWQEIIFNSSIGRLTASAAREETK